MRAPHIVLAVLVGIGVASSIAVIPRDHELALMYLKGLDLESAQVAFEQRLKSGDLSVGVVVPLARVYLEMGEFDAAVVLMERFAAANPDDAEVKVELAKLYKQASRIYDYVSILADLARIRPTEKILRELSDHYGDHGETEKQIEVLRVLVRRFNPTLDDWMDLAQIEADFGNFEASSMALRELDRRHKVARNQRTIEFYISVLARTGREAEAYELSRTWLDETMTAPTALGMVRQFVGAGKELQALAILDRLEPAIGEEPVLFAERVRLELRLGRRDVAFQRLRVAYAADRLPPDLDDDLIDLALERNLMPMALAVALRGSPIRLPDWQLSSLVGMTPTERKSDVAKWVLAAPQFLERRPVLAASVLKTIGDVRGALAMADRALANPTELSADQVLGLILILADLDRLEQARRQLASLLDRFGWEEALALDIANAMIRLGQSVDGWRRIQVVRDRQRQRLPAIDAAWALLSAAAGRADQVVEWVEGPQADQLDAAILGQLADLAIANGQPKLALAAARRLVAVRDGEDTRLQLARALAALGRQEEALAEVRPLRANSPEAERLYVIALATVAKRADAAAQTELAEFWRQQLASADLEAETLSVLVYTLLDKGLGAETLPAIF